jgi:hypothetical protein
MFKSMNRFLTECSGFRRCNGSSTGLLAPAIEMTGGEGFAKVMLWFSLVLLYFG